MDSKKLLKRLVPLIFFIFVVNFLANKFHWYYSIWYFDMLMHFLGGFWLALAGIWCFSESFRLSLESKALTVPILKILLFVLIVGVGWEVFEISVNEIITKNAFNYLDTVSDIFFDLSGGASAILYSAFSARRPRGDFSQELC